MIVKDKLSRGGFLEWLTQIYATADTEIECEQAQTLLAAYVEAELADADLEDRWSGVRDHLTHCPDCQDEYAALRLVAELEAQGALPAPDELLAQLGSGVTARSLTHLVPGP
jgi:hypothetical protein